MGQFESPAGAARGYRVLVTSRPYGLADEQAGRLGVPRAPIEDLPEPLQRLLVQRWFRVLIDDDARAQATAGEMLAHLGEREWLAPLTTSPMLLTAMCVIYQGGKRLPQDRHDLYRRIVDHVLHNRLGVVRDRI